jgi:hypothetical protein
LARKSKYSPECVARIVEAIEQGSTYELAASYAGIHYDTFRVWQAEKPAFSEAVKAAEGRAALKWLKLIEQAAKDGSWQAAAWKLERRYPEKYGRTVVNNQVTGEAGGPIRLIVDHQPTEAAS